MNGRLCQPHPFTTHLRPLVVHPFGKQALFATSSRSGISYKLWIRLSPPLQQSASSYLGMRPERHHSSSVLELRRDERICRNSSQSDPMTISFSVRSWIKSGLSLVSLLLVASSAPLSRYLYLLNFVISTRNPDEISSEAGIRGGIGIWGACREQVDPARPSQPRLCTFASPLGVPALASLPVPLPTLPSYLPPYFSPVLFFFLALALACAFVQHALRSYILWGEITEYGRVSTYGKKEEQSDGSSSYQPNSYDGPNRFGGIRWKNMWETVSRELAIVNAQSCIIVVGILLFPLVPSTYILNSSIYLTDGNVVTSLFLVPGWGTALLVLSVACSLTLRPSSSRSRSRSRSKRSTSDSCRRSSTLLPAQFHSQKTHNGHHQKSRPESQNGATCEDIDLPPPLYQSTSPSPFVMDSAHRSVAHSSKVHPSFLNKSQNKMDDPKKSHPIESFWVPVLAFAEMSEGEPGSPETDNKEGTQVVQVEFWV